MYEKPGMVDAFYSVLAFRLINYGIKFEGKAGDYQESLIQWSLFKVAMTQAMNWKSP